MKSIIGLLVVAVGWSLGACTEAVPRRRSGPGTGPESESARRPDAGPRVRPAGAEHDGLGDGPGDCDRWTCRHDAAGGPALRDGGQMSIPLDDGHLSDRVSGQMPDAGDALVGLDAEPDRALEPDAEPAPDAAATAADLGTDFGADGPDRVGPCQIYVTRVSCTPFMEIEGFIQGSAGGTTTIDMAGCPDFVFGGCGMTFSVRGTYCVTTGFSVWHDPCAGAARCELFFPTGC